jgi:hypothetical protein
MAILLLLCVATVALWAGSHAWPWGWGTDSGFHWNIIVDSISGSLNVILDGTPAEHLEWYTPYWKLLALWVGLGIWHIVPWDRLAFRKQKERGLCAVCGYDLRATPERCPECGRVPNSVKSPT